MTTGSTQIAQKSIEELIEEIKKGTVNPKLLPPSQFELCVGHICFEQGEAQSYAAHLLKRNRRTIAKCARRILEKAAKELETQGIGLYEVVMRLKWVTDLVMQRARTEGDWRLYLESYHKFVDQLKDLGVVYRAPAQIEMHTYSEEKWDALENLVIEVLEAYPGAKEELVLRLEKQRSYNGSGNGHDS